MFNRLYDNKFNYVDQISIFASGSHWLVNFLIHACILYFRGMFLHAIFFAWVKVSKN